MGNHPEIPKLVDRIAEFGYVVKFESFVIDSDCPERGTTLWEVLFENDGVAGPFTIDEAVAHLKSMVEFFETRAAIVLQDSIATRRLNDTCFSGPSEIR